MLIIIFGILVVTLFVLLWGLTLFAQGYWYNEPVSNLPWRALGAAVVVAGVLTLWTNVNAKADRKGKYGPLHDFDSTSMTEVTEFVAVRSVPGPAGQPPTEERATFKRAEGQKALAFAEEKTRLPFRLNTTTYMTTALEYKEGEKLARYDAVMQNNSYTADKRFVEAGTKRFVEGNDPGMVFAPSSKTMVYAILLNLAHFLAWFGAFWLILRFMFWHSVGLAILFGMLTMVVVAPILFERARGAGPTKANVEQVAPVSIPTNLDAIPVAPAVVDAPVDNTPIKE